jgi:hypothetical protein
MIGWASPVVTSPNVGSCRPIVSSPCVSARCGRRAAAAGPEHGVDEPEDGVVVDRRELLDEADALQEPAVFAAIVLRKGLTPRGSSVETRSVDSLPGTGFPQP